MGNLARVQGEQARFVNDENEPVFRYSNRQGKGNFLLLCEHASNFIPNEYNNLGMPSKLNDSHIAWDPGAIEVAEYLSILLDAPLISQNISRLVYDCNRPPSVKSAIPQVSEIYEIPGNKNLNSQEISCRVESVYLPFKNEIENFIALKLEQGLPPAIVTIHSFTPIYHGLNRDVEIGILHDDDHRLADEMLIAGQSDGEYIFERNSPYGPEHGVTHSLQEYGIKNSLPNVMIEIRNDLVRTDKQQKSVGALLAKILAGSIANIRQEGEGAHA